MKNEYLKLCLVTSIASRSLDQYKKLIINAIHGGVKSVQLREKNLSFEELKSLALSLQSILKPLNIPLIINDHVNLAKEINADGVHLGQADMSPLETRKILGPNKIIGLSIESMQELEIANQLNCINYVAASAIFPSKTKRDCKTLWGLEGLKQLTEKAFHPVIAIGGINSRNVSKVIENGAFGVAVVSIIHDHSHPEKISALLINKINSKLLPRKNHA